MVRNRIDNIDTFWYGWVTIPYLGIDTWYCHWYSDQKCQKNEITGNGAETGQMSKKPKNFEKIRSPKVEIHQNRWLTYGCEVCDGDFRKDI